jgi:hypothetical protein
MSLASRERFFESFPSARDDSALPMWPQSLAAMPSLILSTLDTRNS